MYKPLPTIHIVGIDSAMTKFDKMQIKDLFKALIKEGSPQNIFTWIKAKKIYKSYKEFLRSGMIRW
jgi:hypothetical protein